jgi:uncharacterized protein (UPF0303 family)
MTDISVLEQQERDLLFDRFDHDDAWRLGVLITDAARQAGHEVAVDIRRPGLILFRAALPGSKPNQESWISGKSAVVLRMEESSALVAARQAASGRSPEDARLGVEYAVTGGSFPVRVRGVGIVAAVTVSGLTSQEDHDVVVAGIRAHLAGTAAA